jgi:Leucine-rich repeat (LRR) protein
LLTLLDLGYNQLNGSIPESIGDLDQLQELYLDNNQLSGTIPSSIGSSSLEYLYLYSNQLSGLIPISIADMPNLSSCFVSLNSDLCRVESFTACGTDISGILLLDLTISIVCASDQTTASMKEATSKTDHFSTTEQPEQTTSFAQTTTGGQTTTEAETTTIWTEATTTDCAVLNAWQPDHANSTGCCNEEGITCNDDRITQMYVYPSNNISDFSGRSLSGSIPESIASLDALVSLVLYNNQLTGQIPTSIGDLVKLQNLDLYNNLLSGIIPDNIGSMVNLQTLYLNDNMLSGSIPESIGTLDLKIIYLDSNQFNGEIPSSLSSLPLNVTCIVLPNSGLCREESFTKCGVDILGIHSKLTHTVCPDDGESYNTTLTLTMATKTVEMTTTTTEAAVDDVCQVTLPTTTAEYATDCEILNAWQPDHASSSGCCESGFNNPNPRIYCVSGRVVKLYFIILLSNLSAFNDLSITGPIPDSIGKLTALSSLKLHTNQLSGAIPASIGDLVHLELLELHNNQVYILSP